MISTAASSRFTAARLCGDSSPPTFLSPACRVSVPRSVRKYQNICVFKVQGSCAFVFVGVSRVTEPRIDYE